MSLYLIIAKSCMYCGCTYICTYTYGTYVHISRYHGKRGKSLWVIRYIPQFELAVRHLWINHYCSLSLMSNHCSCPSFFTYLAAVDGIYISLYHKCGITSAYTYVCMYMYVYIHAGIGASHGYTYIRTYLNSTLWTASSTCTCMY